MGKMNIKLSDDTEERFRKAVSYSKGMKKGNISIAIEEAINLWIEEQKGNERKWGKR
jgi:phage gp36-like protein